MRGIGRGFTIVEVSIFLAVTGLLFIGITIGVQNSIFQQRYNDAVQGFADFLRNAYSNVLNVQSLGRGDSDLAIYGKMLVFGDEESGEQKIRMYSVVGKADIDSSTCEGAGLFDVLSRCGEVSIVRENSGHYEFAGVVEEYKPRWGTKIQKAGEDDDLLSDPEDYKGVVLIVRDPVSGRVHTAVSDNSELSIDIANPGNYVNVISDKLKNGTSNGFDFKQVDFCVNPNGDEPSNRRADVRIVERASNVSGVEIVADSNNSNKCR